MKPTRISQQIHKQSCKDLSERSVNGIFIYLLAWLTISYFTTITTQHSTIAYTFGFILLLTSIPRLLLVKFFEPLYSKKPQLWQLSFGIGMVISATTWSLFVSWTLFKLGLSTQGLIIILPLILVSAGGIISLSPNRLFLILFIFILTIPILTSLIAMATTEAYVIAFILTVFEAFIIKTGLQIHQSYY